MSTEIKKEQYELESNNNSEDEGGDSPGYIKRRKEQQQSEYSADENNENNQIENENESESNIENKYTPQKEEEYNSEEDGNYELSEESYHNKKKKKNKKQKLLNSKRERTKNKKKKKKKPDGKGLIDFEAEEDENETDSNNEDAEITEKQAKQLKEQYEFKSNLNFHKINDENQDEFIKRFNQTEYLDNYENVPDDEIGHKKYEPDNSGPKLWLIKVKIGKERECVENLYHKYFVRNQGKEPKLIKILSAASFDSLKGYIYVEAFKESNVREAILGMSMFKENSLRIVPINEMTQVFEYDKIQKVELKNNQWVRIKGGLYQNDLAQVIYIEDQISKIYIKLIPRIIEQNQNVDKNINIGEYNKKIKKNIRPKQKLFNPKNFDGVQTRELIPIGKIFIWNKQYFQDGFLIKIVKLSSLLIDNIEPKYEEINIFNMGKSIRDDNENSNEDEGFLDALNNISKRRRFNKGDRVKIIQGDLNGITGKVISHIDKTVSIYPNVVELANEVLEFPEEYLVKVFMPGELVSVISGSNIGKSGFIVKIEDDNDTAVIYSESTQNHYKVSCRDLILSNQLNLERETNSAFKIGDLVQINNTHTICYILDASKYFLKVIDTSNEIKNISIRDVFQIHVNKKNTGIDSRRNPITKDNIVKIINGPYKGAKATIKCLYKKFVFLHNNDYIQSNGIFVDICDNIEILGSELLMENGENGRVNQRKVPEEIQNLIGKVVHIIKGVWKGYNGILKDANDKFINVELMAKQKTIRLNFNDISRGDVNDSEGGKNDSMMTPNMAYKTPAYYPQTPTAHSPGWNSMTTPNNYKSPNPFGS